MTTLFLAHERTSSGGTIWTPIECANLKEAAREMLHIDRPAALFAIDTEAGTCRDVSQHAAMEMACLIMYEHWTLTDERRDFIEQYSRPGSLVPAAA